MGLGNPLAAGVSWGFCERHESRAEPEPVALVNTLAGPKGTENMYRWLHGGYMTTKEKNPTTKFIAGFSMFSTT
jgi:hypothetical protein